MPYITKNRRDELEYGCGFNADDDYIISPGELNYCITLLCTAYATRKVSNYQVYNDIIGALECAKQEFYRRMIAPYEDIKIKENGDVY